MLFRCGRRRSIPKISMQRSNALAAAHAHARLHDPALAFKRTEIAQLNALALRSLETCFEPRQRFFCRRVFLREEELLPAGVSLRGTLVALLGLHTLSEAGIDTGFDTKAIFAAVLDDPTWICTAEDLGLLIWSTALYNPSSSASMLRWIENECHFFHTRGMQRWRTRDLAIVLAGLAHAQVSKGSHTDTTDLAADIYHALEERQSEVGLFSSFGRLRSLVNFVGERFTAFSDQALSIYSLAKFAEAFEVDEPLDAAMRCADSLCRMQGPLGQWWSHYDKKQGCVASAYPVMSEHQGGLGPMAFLALTEASGRSFYEPVFKGVSWFFGANEIAMGVGNDSSGPIWDSINVRGSAAVLRNYMSSLMGVPRAIGPERLAVCRDMRPDVFGWLLYAFGSFGLGA